MARQQSAAESDPKNAGRRLLADGRLTKWQARQLLHGGRADDRALQAAGPSGRSTVTRVFLAQHGQSGQKVELRSLSRSHAAERPDAVQEFVAAAEKLSVAENRKLLEVHRPEGQDDTCFVALEEPVGGVSAAAAVASSDWSLTFNGLPAKSRKWRPSRTRTKGATPPTSRPSRKRRRPPPWRSAPRN